MVAWLSIMLVSGLASLNHCLNIAIVSNSRLLKEELKIFNYYNFTPKAYGSVFDIYTDYNNSFPIAVFSYKENTNAVERVSGSLKIPFILNDVSVTNQSSQDKYIMSSKGSSIMRYIFCELISKRLQYNHLFVVYSSLYEKRIDRKTVLYCFSAIQYQLHFFPINSNDTMNSLMFDIKLKNMFQILLLTDESLTISILNSLGGNKVSGTNFVWIIVGNLEIFRGDQFNFSNTNILIIGQEVLQWNVDLEKSFIGMTNAVGYSTTMNLCNFLGILNMFQQTYKENITTNNQISIFNSQEYFQYLKFYYEQNLAYQMWSSNGSQSKIGLVLSVNRIFQVSYPSNLLNFTALSKEKIQFLGFNNRTIRICTIENSPFVTRINISGKFVIENMSGFVIKMVSHLSRKLQFKPEIYVAADGAYGGPVDRQQYFSGCVGDVQQKKAEMAASVFTFTSDRSSVVDFTYPIMSDPLGIIYHKPKESSKWFNAVNALDFKAWLMIPICMILVSLTTTFICKYSPFSAWNLKLKFAIIDEIQFTENLWTVVGAFLLQGQDFYAYPISARVVLAFWWIFSVIILSVFSADLTSYLTTDTGTKLPKTLEEFALRDDIFLYLVNGSSAANIIKKSQDLTLQKLSQKGNIVPSCNKLLLNQSVTNAACVTDYSYIRYLVEKNCTRFAYIPEFIESAIVGFVVPKYSEYKSLLNYEIQRLTNRGIIHTWFLEDLNQRNNSVCSTQADIPDPIDFNMSIGIFFILYAIYIIGMVFLNFEFGVNKISKCTN